jgi:predicted glycosyltransferase
MSVTPAIDKSRLDVLIYSHDGRGFSHVSRGVTIGMALRRLFPKLKVLFVSGFKQTATLVGSCPLEWIKLPSYETQIIAGKSKGRLGNTNIKNCYLGPARANIIESIIAVPWLSQTSLTFLQNLYKALSELGERYGRWKIFIDLKKIEAEANSIKLKFDGMSYCSVENVSDRYLAALANSRVALVYGGYNSLTDIMAARVPSVVIVRGMNDREQEEHVRKIRQLKPNLIYVLKETEAEWKTLAEGLEQQLNIEIGVESEIMLNGAEVSADKIVEPLGLSNDHPA